MEKNFQNLKIILWPVFLLLIFCSLNVKLPVAVAASQDEKTNVRVGYFSNGDFMRKESDGSFTGYDIEYYYMISGYMNWNVQIIEYQNLNSALSALENGDIDILSGLSKTPEREEKYLVSNSKMCSALIAVQVRSDDDRFSAGDPSTMTNLTCGILKASNVIALYTDWCKKNGLIPHIVEYDTLKMRNAALADGEVDAIAGGSTIKGAQKIAEFPSTDLFFMLNKKRSDLKTQLDRAMEIITLQDPNFSPDLFKKYFPSSRNSEPSFSAPEKAFIVSHPVIRMAILKNDIPFSRVTSDGVVKGIIPEYNDHLSKMIGTKFLYIPYSSTAEIIQALSEGKVDIAGKFENNIYSAVSNGVILTVPYLKMNLVQITHIGTNHISSAAVPECNRRTVLDSLSKTNSSLKIVECANSEQCFSLMKSGKADSIICSQPAGSCLLNRNRVSDYTISAFDSDDWMVTYALPENSEGNILRTILNKTILVDDGYIGQLITKDTLQDSANLSNIFERMPISFLAGTALVSVFLLAVAAVAIFMIIRRRRIEKKLAVQKSELAAAVKANEMRNDFFGAVSHDMRTPLNAIIGFAGLAQEGPISPKTKDYLEKIQSSGKLLNSLLDDTLTISKANSGKLEFHPEPVNTDELLNEIIVPIREAAEKRNIAFTVDRSAFPAQMILADKLNVQKILLNLLSNAVKYSKPGGQVKFRVYPAESMNENELSLVFIIEDNGIGISKEFLPHIYEPFSQERQHGFGSSGTGLGLSIVKELVDKMGGNIAVQSEKEVGTTFTVQLHFKKVNSIENEAREENVRGKVHLEGKKILLCEDNALNREIAVAMLQNKGMKVDTAENGLVGVQKFANSKIDEYSAILMDIRMPVLSGYEAVKQIRALTREDAKTIPIIAMTADAFDEDVKKCFDAGMNGHIAKPINPGQMFDLLQNLISPSK